jgi:hypothetical protein
VIELFEPNEQLEIFEEVGISKEMWNTALVDAANSERTPNEDMDITVLVAQRLARAMEI